MSKDYYYYYSDKEADEDTLKFIIGMICIVIGTIFLLISPLIGFNLAMENPSDKDSEMEGLFSVCCFGGIFLLIIGFVLLLIPTKPKYAYPYQMYPPTQTVPNQYQFYYQNLERNEKTKNIITRKPLRGN